VPESDAYAFAFFAFAWAALYLLYLVLSMTALPVAYNIWAHLALECVTVVFWLVAFALLARNASDYSSVESDYINLDKSVYDLYMATYSAAGLSALVWLLFVATLVWLGFNVHRHLHQKGVATNPAANPAMTNPVNPNAGVQGPNALPY
jgi:hypothetical protein